MSLRHAIRVVAVWSFVLACSASASAKELRNSLEIQGFGQWVAVDVLDGKPAIAQENGWGGGFSIGYNILDWLEAEFDYSHLSNDFRAFDPSTATPCLLRRCRTTTDAFTFFGTFNVPAGEVLSPYLRFGVGGFVTDDPLFRSRGVAVAGGGGVRLFPAPGNGLNIRVGTDVAGLFPTSVGGYRASAWDRTTMDVRVTFGIGYVIDIGR